MLHLLRAACCWAVLYIALIAQEPTAPTEPQIDLTPRPADGTHLALSIHKLQGKGVPGKPFLIWAIGSSYTNMLGNGELLIPYIKQKFPNAPEIVYKKMVGSAVPYDYVRGWVHQFVVAEQPDLVLCYALGTPEALEEMLSHLRRHTTADIIVPSLHLRAVDKLTKNSIESEHWNSIREVCEQFDVEFVENRREWASYLMEKKLPISALIKDPVHQSPAGAKLINLHIARHFAVPKEFSYQPSDRERFIPAGKNGKKISLHGNWKQVDGKLITSEPGASVQVNFTGNRIDLLGTKLPAGGTVKVLIDGVPADTADVFYRTHIEPPRTNYKKNRGLHRDIAPHCVFLGTNIVPQDWTIKMISDVGDYELIGSVTGPDGKGNNLKMFKSNSGQIIIDPLYWRNPKRDGEFTNRTGDIFPFNVYRASVGTVKFQAEKKQEFYQPLVQNLTNTTHTLTLQHLGGGEINLSGFYVYQPPLATTPSGKKRPR